MVPQKHIEPSVRPATLTIPELEQSKAAVLNTLASVHSHRCYAFAIDRFIAWYCSEPRLTFNRAVVVRYRSHLEGLSLSASTINSHLSAIRRLADESAESGWLTPELAIGIRRVQGVKRRAADERLRRWRWLESWRYICTGCGASAGTTASSQSSVRTRECPDIPMVCCKSPT
jgi:hypothetical protein